EKRIRAGNDACIKATRSFGHTGPIAHGGAADATVASHSEDGAARRGASGLSARTRIAVVRSLHGLGDMLCAVPALTALRRANPDAHISLIGLPACRWMLERFGALIDALLPFPGFPGIPEQPPIPGALARFFGAARANPFDLAIQMHGCGTVSNAFTVLLGART